MVILTFWRILGQAVKNGNFMTSHLKNHITDWFEIFTEVKTCQYLVTQQISDKSVDSGEMTGWPDMEFPRLKI